MVVWHIVAHVEYGLGGYLHLLAEIPEGRHLIGHAEVYMLAAEHLKAGGHALGAPPRDDSHWETVPVGLAYGVSIAGIGWA